MDLVPGGVDVVGVGHVGHRAAGGHVRQHHADVLGREDVGRFGHEVDAAEEIVLGLCLLGGVLAELEAVAGEVGELDDLVALVVVAEDDEPLAEDGASGADAAVRLVGAHLEVGAGNVLLPADEGRLLDERDRDEGIGGTGVRVAETGEQFDLLGRCQPFGQSCHGVPPWTAT